jgi:hypothetical protein
LIEVAKWWIATHQLDHFEKAVKIKEMIKAHPNATEGRKGVNIIMENKN